MEELPPQEEIDYVLVYEKEKEEAAEEEADSDASAAELEEQRHVAELTSRVRTAFLHLASSRFGGEGLRMRLYEASVNGRELVFVLVSTPFSRLEMEAERLRLNMPLEGLEEIDIEDVEHAW